MGHACAPVLSGASVEHRRPADNSIFIAVGYCLAYGGGDIAIAQAASARRTERFLLFCKQSQSIDYHCYTIVIVTENPAPNPLKLELSTIAPSLLVLVLIIVIVIVGSPFVYPIPLHLQLSIFYFFCYTNLSS